MKFEHSWTGNWENAFRGLRHPMESYAKSDSYMNTYVEWGSDNSYKVDQSFTIGKNDLDLAQRMIKAGSPNDKFLRQIFVSVDITAPLFWWKEMDTYKVATVANSTSTMHKLATTPITLDCFETDDFDREWLNNTGEEAIADTWIEDIIFLLENFRLKYLKTKDIRYWKELIRWLPESWLQTRTWTANYSVLRNIIHWRKGHKLTEWKSFCNWVEDLPYTNELILFEN